MIYTTGDSHGLIDFQRLKDYFSNIYVSRKDYLIILGDAGIIWNENDVFIDEYEMLGLTTIFIDGNHENFHLLSKFPIVERYGAKMHLLSDHIFHLLRGEIFELNGISFLGVGGASSIDKARRIKNLSYWEEENITQKDIDNALKNLSKRDYKVDYVLSHASPRHIHEGVFGYSRDINALLLEDLSLQCEFKHYYFGHYHRDLKIDDRYRAFYYDIEVLPSIDKGKRKAYKPYYRDWGDGYLRTFSRHWTRLKREDLPEYYFENYNGYSTDYYCLRNVKDVAFEPSWSENHLNKDARLYFSYSLKRKKDRYLAPKDEKEWGLHTWRAPIYDLILGLEKYSPKLNLKRLKVQYNSAVNRFNNFCFENEYLIIPYLELSLEKDFNQFGKRISYLYQLNYQKTIYGYFLEKERADSYRKWLIKKLGILDEESLSLVPIKIETK